MISYNCVHLSVTGMIGGYIMTALFYHSFYFISFIFIISLLSPIVQYSPILGLSFGLFFLLLIRVEMPRQHCGGYM